MHTSSEIISIQQRLVNIRKPSHDIDPSLVDLFDLIEDEHIITHAMLDAILTIRPMNTKDLYFCLAFISKTALWQASAIPRLFLTLTKHQSISTLRECLLILEDVDVLDQHFNLLIHHDNLLDVLIVLQRLKIHKLFNGERLLALLNHPALGMVVDALMVQDHSSPYITLILNTTCAKEVDKVIRDEACKKKMAQLIASNAVDLSPETKATLDQTSDIATFARALDYLLFASATQYFNALIKNDNQELFNVLCALIQSAELNLHKRKQSKLINRVLEYKKSDLCVFHELLNNPFTAQFFKTNIEQIILPSHFEGVQMIQAFINNKYTKSLFTGPETDQFLGYIIKRNRGGLNPQLQLIESLGRHGFLSNTKKNAYCHEILSRSPIGYLPKVIQNFFETNLDGLTDERPSSSNPKAWDYLEGLLYAYHPDAIKRYLDTLTVPLKSIFPTEPPESLSLLAILKSPALFNRFELSIKNLKKFLNKKIFFSTLDYDIQYKGRCLTIFNQADDVLTLALWKIKDLLSEEQALCLDFFASPNRPILKHILLTLDDDVINAASFARLMHVSAVMGAMTTLGVWTQIQRSALTKQHFSDLLLIAERGVANDVMQYLITLFNLGAAAPVGVTAPAINYDQSTHNQHVHKTVSDSAARLLARYFGLIDRDGYPFYMKQIQDWGRSEPHAQDLYTRCLSRILTISYVDKQSNIPLISLFVLVWIAIQDDDCRVGPLTDALGLLKEALYEIQRGYNINPLGVDNARADSPICAGGTFNKLMEKFTSVHPDIQVCFMSPATASLKLKHVVQEEVVKYCINSQSRELADAVQENGVSEIWAPIRDIISEKIYDEFQDLYPQGKASVEFVQMIAAGIDIDISHLNLPQLFETSGNRPSSSSSSKRSYSSFFTPQHDEEPEEDGVEPSNKFAR